jgi:hypothetical protein
MTLGSPAYLVRHVMHARYSTALLMVPSRAVASYVAELVCMPLEFIFANLSQDKATKVQKNGGHREAARWLLTRFMLQKPELFFTITPAYGEDVGDEPDGSDKEAPLPKRKVKRNKGRRQQDAETENSASGQKEGRGSLLTQALMEETQLWPGIAQESTPNKKYLVSSVCTLQRFPIR